MTYDVFFAGVGGTVLGALLGAWFAYRFQKKLLDQQLAFQRSLHEESLTFQKAQGELDAETRRKISNNTLSAIHDAGQHIKFAIGHAAKRTNSDK